ncbi:hypothetical protein G6F57_019424 [Rhizopus arrhizus]|nr:hypothetical protein G6F57_019424 [Rhizopus arrhizus]
MSDSTDTVSWRAASSRAATRLRACTTGSIGGAAVGCARREPVPARVLAVRLAAAPARLFGVAATACSACGVLSVMNPVLAALVVWPTPAGRSPAAPSGKGETLPMPARYTAPSVFDSALARHVVMPQALPERPTAP